MFCSTAIILEHHFDRYENVRSNLCVYNMHIHVCMCFVRVLMSNLCRYSMIATDTFLIYSVNVCVCVGVVHVCDCRSNINEHAASFLNITKIAVGRKFIVCVRSGPSYPLMETPKFRCIECIYTNAYMATEPYKIHQSTTVTMTTVAAYEKSKIQPLGTR